MSVLVTGGMGGIGSFVTRSLIEAGDHPVVYARHRDTTLLKGFEKSYEYVQGDVLDLANVIRTVRDHKVQKVIHLSAMVDCQANPLGALKTNVEGTVHILETARALGVERVVYASSVRAIGPITAEYGHPTYKPLTEDHPINPEMVYDVTKLAAERLGRNYERNYGVHFVAVRFAQTYGPGRLSRNPGAYFHSRIIETAMLGKSMTIPRGGDARLDFIYTKDVAQGLVKACFTQNLEHRLFHLGTGQGVSLREFVQTVTGLYPHAAIEVGPGTDARGLGLPYDFILDISRARRELGFEPVYDLAAGIRDYGAVMEAEGIPPAYIP